METTIRDRQVFVGPKKRNLKLPCPGDCSIGLNIDNRISNTNYYIFCFSCCTIVVLFFFSIRLFDYE